MSPRALKLLTAVAMLAALAGVVVIAGWTQLSAYLSRPGPAGEEVTVILPRGAGVAQIAGHLAEARVIRQPLMFRLAVRVLGRDRELKAGEYAFPAQVTPRGVIGMLASGETVARRLTVAEGLTVAEIFRLLEEAEALTGPLPEAPREGSLLPETYFYAYGDSRTGMVKRMQQAMRRTLDELWAERNPDLPFASPEEVLVLASIVDKETALESERDKVAAVFVNRLRRNMRLQSDPTVIYHLTGGDGRLGRPLRRSDLAENGPYNTYQVDGLPPGPIANPGRDALAAVIGPADVDYLYFVADGTGGHVFARTLDEHNRNVARWRRIQRGEVRPPDRPPPPPKPEPEATPAADGSASPGPTAAEPAVAN